MKQDRELTMDVYFCTPMFPHVTEISKTSNSSGFAAKANSIARVSSTPWGRLGKAMISSQGFATHWICVDDYAVSRCHIVVSACA